jgi:hypothetical protein
VETGREARDAEETWKRTDERGGGTGGEGEGRRGGAGGEGERGCRIDSGRLCVSYRDARVNIARVFRRKARD